MIIEIKGKFKPSFLITALDSHESLGMAVFSLVGVNSMWIAQGNNTHGCKMFRNININYYYLFVRTEWFEGNFTFHV